MFTFHNPKQNSYNDNEDSVLQTTKGTVKEEELSTKNNSPNKS